MNQIPQSFLLVNHEGVHRCFISLEQVANFDQLLTKFSREKYLLLKNLATNPYGDIHLAVHTGNPYPIAILEAAKGTMGLQTQYHLIKAKDGQEWLSPRFISSSAASGSFELRCEFDFALWAGAGLQMFFAINTLERQLNLWAGFDYQIYRVPFANVFDTSAVLCTGGGNEISALYVQPLAALEKLVIQLSASIWNADAFTPSYIEPVSMLVRFDPETLKMLPPLKPELITKLGIIGNPVLAEIMKLYFQ